MKNEVRPIDANALARNIREYMADFKNSPARKAACCDILSMLGDEGQTPTLTDHFRDLTKMLPLTPEQLQVMDGPVWCSCKPLEGGNGYWCLCQKGNIITPGGSIYNIKDIPNWVFYAYPPAHIDREAWVSVEDRIPEDENDGETVLVIVFGKPHENITLHGVIMTAGYFRDEGWVLNEYPEWEGPEVTHWMPLPSPPAELEKRLRGVRA